MMMFCLDRDCLAFLPKRSGRSRSRVLGVPTQKVWAYPSKQTQGWDRVTAYLVPTIRTNKDFVENAKNILLFKTWLNDF
jgi:hypothetical protein